MKLNDSKLCEWNRSLILYSQYLSRFLVVMPSLIKHAGFFRYQPPSIELMASSLDTWEIGENIWIADSPHLSSLSNGLASNGLEKCVGQVAATPS